jgi:RNA polymerase sigma factor (sigma-70 family)
MNELNRNLRTIFGDGSISGLADGELLGRFAASHDEAAFEALVVRHGPMVWGVCKRTLRDPNDAEDAFQATFLVLARKASSIAHREMVANWLFAVARKTAVRARAMAFRRWSKEQQVVAMPEPEPAADDRRDDLLALLDEELSRLPRKYRIPVVACELEGKTHREAASELGWPVGTVSSRLSRGRAMLSKRLARSGVSLSIGSLAVLLNREAASATVPARLIRATAQTATLFLAGGAPGLGLAKAFALTREVLRMMLVSKLKVATLILLVIAGTGVIWSASGAIGAGQERKPEAPKPPPIATAKAQTLASPKWARLMSDAGFESWVRLEDGRSLWKSEKYAGVHDPASGIELNYQGNGPIVRRPELVAVMDNGGLNVAVALERAGVRPLDVAFALERAGVRPLDPRELRSRMTEEGRKIEGGNFRSDALVVDLDSRRCLRIDMSRHDSLGQLRLSEQTWYDVETRRPIQRREILQLADQTRYKREFRTTTITYVDDGPADIYALGVPAGTPIVDQETLDKVASPPALQDAFNGAARAIEQLPLSVRIVEDGNAGLQLTYWSAHEGFLGPWAAFVRDHNDSKIHATPAPRSFFADHQGFSGAEIPPALRTRPENDLPADALAAWLPVERSVNVHLKDGTRGYDLTRFITAPDRPKDVRVHVHRDDSATFPPDWLRTIWPFAFDNRQNLHVIPSGPGTPKGWVAIKVEYPEIQSLYYADPAHGYAVARMVESTIHNGGRMKFRTESKALHWTQLPGGVWYVKTWERLHHLDKLDAAGKPEAAQQPDYTTFRRVVITAMDPVEFPAGIFDGEKLLDAARKEGATIKVD